MMYQRRFILGITLLFLASFVAGPSRGDEAFSKQQHDKVRESIQALTEELDRLQQDVVEELEGENKLALYQRLDQLSSNLDSLSGKVGSQLTRSELYRRFQSIDQEIHKIFRLAEQKEHRSLRQSLRRAYFADLELHYRITQGTEDREKKLEVAGQQAKAFAALAERVKETAAIAYIDGAPVQFQDLTRSAAQLDKQFANGSDAETVKNEFQKMNLHWAKVVELVKSLPPKKNLHLLRTTVQLDRLHERLFQLLGIEGERAVLTIRI